MFASLVTFMSKLKNSYQLRANIVSLQLIRQNIKLIKILYKENYILSFSCVNSLLQVYIKNDRDFLMNLKFLSKPSNIQYIGYRELCRFVNKHKLIILSTVKHGLITGQESKKKKREVSYYLFYDNELCHSYSLYF